MSARIAVQPVWELACDHDGCESVIREVGGRTDWAVRDTARREGWQLRPCRGKGSRSAPDLCPGHRTGGTR